jgi:hypothetical protein
MPYVRNLRLGEAVSTQFPAQRSHNLFAVNPEKVATHLLFSNLKEKGSTEGPTP